MNNKMSDEEFAAFLKAIPTDLLSPFGDYETYLNKEGVTIDDINWWKGLSLSEQNAIKEDQQMTNVRLMLAYTSNNGMTPIEAQSKIYKDSPHHADYPYASQIISELKQLGYSSENDYPLPWELSNRIENYSNSIIRDPEGFKNMQDIVRTSTSGSDAIRILIRKGLL